MEVTAHGPEKLKRTPKRVALLVREHARIDVIARAREAVAAPRQPEERMQIAKPALPFLDVGLDHVARLANLGVALIAFLGLIGLKRLDGPLDGAIYGGVVGLGFTFTEDILYVAQQYARVGLGGFVVLLFLRTVLLGFSHCTFTACTGLGFGIAAESKSVAVKLLAPLLGFGCAMAMHAMHNGLPTFFGDGGLILMLLASWLIDLLFFALLWVLVTRDRSIVIRELLGEVGTLIHPSELKLVSSYVTLGVKNLRIFFALGFSAWRARRKKQLSLVELAFLKSRRRRGETGPALDEQEAKLRHAIGEANRVGIRVGA